MATKDIDRIKMCVEVKLIDDTDVIIKIIYIDENIGKLEENTLYSDHLNFTIKKGKEIKYTPISIIIPTKKNIDNFDKESSYKFSSDSNRKYLLNTLAHNILIFIKRFSKNPDSRIHYLKDKWFFY